VLLFTESDLGKPKVWMMMSINATWPQISFTLQLFENNPKDLERQSVDVTSKLKTIQWKNMFWLGDEKTMFKPSNQLPKFW